MANKGFNVSRVTIGGIDHVIIRDGRRVIADYDVNEKLLKRKHGYVRVPGTSGEIGNPIEETLSEYAGKHNIDLGEYQKKNLEYEDEKKCRELLKGKSTLDDF